MTRRPLLLTLLMLFITPTAAQALPQTGVTVHQAPPVRKASTHISKASYIRTADAVCTSMNVELAPALAGTREAMTTGSYTETQGEAVTASAKTAKATFLQLRALTRPAAGTNELVRYFNAESKRLTDLSNVGVDESNEEPVALGEDSADAEIESIAANAAISHYGFKVCGLS